VLTTVSCRFPEKRASSEKRRIEDIRRGISSTALRPKHDVGSRNSNERITEEEMTNNTRRPTIDRLLNLPTIEAIASVLGLAAGSPPCRSQESSCSKTFRC
jgi:hypothetical protein